MRNIPFLFFVIFSFFLQAQTQDFNLEISSLNVLDIKKQKNGLIWVATDEGLNVFYDNEKYVFYSNIQDSLSILNSKVDHLFVTLSDDLIVLTQDGLSIFKSEAFNFTQIKLNSKPVSIVEDSFNSNLWVATENSGYYLINDKYEIAGHFTFDPLSPLSISTSNLAENDFESIIFSEKKVFIATNNGFNIFDQNLNTFKRFFKGKKSLFTTNDIKSIIELDSKIVISTKNEVVLYDPKENKFESKKLIDGEIFSSHSLIDNSIVLKTSKKDYNVSVTENTLFLKPLTKINIPDGENVFLDDNKIYSWTKNTNRIYILDNDFSNQKIINVDGLINSLTISEEEVLIGTNNGIKSFNEDIKLVKKINEFDSSDFFYSYENKLVNIIGNKIQIFDLITNKYLDIKIPLDLSEMSFETDKNFIFFGLNNIHTFNLDSLVFYQSIITGDSFKNYTINNLKSIDNTLYVSHDNGLFEFSKEMVKNKNSNSEIIFYDYNELLNNSVPRGFVDILKIDSSFYVTNQQFGLSLYENDLNSFVKNFKFNGNPIKSLATSTPTKLFYSKGEDVLYIGSIGSGLFKYNLSENTFSNLDVQDGMLSSNVYNFLQLPNRLFFQSGTGINFLEKGLVKNITIEDGINPVTFHNKSLHFNNNQFIVSGNESIQSFPLELINSSNDKFNINTFNIIGIDELNNKNIIPLKENNIEIDYQTKSILFDLYSDNSYKSNQLKYFVQKVDDNELIRNGFNNQVQLSGLPYYTSNLSFYAVNGNGVRSNNSIEISVYNAPPWWLRVESIVGYFILLIVFITFFVKYREKKTKERMEGERKSKELEEAKELQNSLLPKVNPKIAGYEISTYLKPATEIGGDYYDFFYKKDDYFYAICGDATGHGVISGIMVSVTKAGLHGIPMGDPSSILGKLNRIVKRVNFGRLRMSLSVAKFNEKSVELSSAAMPPTYFFSSKTKKLEEVLVPNLPLGGIETEIFDGIKKDFNPGDVMVMISDGLPELPNPTEEMLDYEKVESCIRKNSENSAVEIKDALVYLCDEWANGVMNPDDITIVVIKKAA